MSFANFQSELLNHEMLLEPLLSTPTSQANPASFSQTLPSERPGILQDPTHKIHSLHQETILHTNMFLPETTLASLPEIVLHQTSKLPWCNQHLYKIKAMPKSIQIQLLLVLPAKYVERVTTVLLTVTTE
jgi:hypothetical protein